MSYDIVLRTRAERAIGKAAEWYRKDSTRVATRFFGEVDHTIERVAENPLQFPVRSGKVRYAIVSGFPYSLLYLVGESSIVITNCVHFSRDPLHWR
ncbi:MAG TPA: type II toxin-antitoxin system RelE/ParE family toxin [Longimicrobium sp.]|nr:type II toxin-antitoxin system RelE/ParE family toxin [Longimicrobium sp.]